jgi:hypothetical protein
VSQAGALAAQTRPGKPSPGAISSARLSAAKSLASGQVSMQRSTPPSGTQTAPKSQFSDAPMAASSAG